MAGDKEPDSVFPTIVGDAKSGENVAGVVSLVGDDATAKLDIKHLVVDGILSDWDAMEKAWHHVFYNELRIPPEDHQVLFSDSSVNTKEGREKTVQIMFETFGVPAVYVCHDAPPVLYAAGRTTGVAVDCIGGKGSAVPVQDGNTVPDTAQQVGIAGVGITDHLVTLLAEKCLDLSSVDGRMAVADEKAKRGMVVENYEVALESFADSRDLEQTYELSDANVISVDTERFRCDEVLFDPGLADKEGKSVQRALFDAVAACPKQQHTSLWANVLFCCGSTVFPGLDKRLPAEVQKLLLPRADLAVVAPADRKHQVWAGGSILSGSSMTSFENRGLLSMSMRRAGRGSCTPSASDPLKGVAFDVGARRYCTNTERSDAERMRPSVSTCVSRNCRSL